MAKYLFLSECRTVSEWTPEAPVEAVSVRRAVGCWAVDCSGVRFHVPTYSAALSLAHSSLTTCALQLGAPFPR